MTATNIVGNPEDIVSVELTEIPLGKPLVIQDGGRKLYRVSTSPTYSCLDTETEEIVAVPSNTQVYFAEVATVPDGLGGASNEFTRVNPPV